MIFIVGTFVNLSVMNGGPTAVDAAAHRWLIGPSIIAIIVAAGTTIKEIIGI